MLIPLRTRQRRLGGATPEGAAPVAVVAVVAVTARGGVAKKPTGDAARAGRPAAAAAGPVVGPVVGGGPLGGAVPAVAGAGSG